MDLIGGRVWHNRSSCGRPTPAPEPARVTRSIRLRPWQKAALDAFQAKGAADFLTVATPGAGKTTFALTAARHVLAERPRSRLIVVAPTAHLKVQWAAAAAKFALHLDPAWAASDGRLPPDMHGIVTTYQQVATSSNVLRELATDAFVIFDEIHHAADDRAWGDSIRRAFETSARRLAISGTPFRSDTSAIPFVNYVLDEAAPDFEYGYGEALVDGRVVRPVYFPRTGGQMEWSAPDGSLLSASFDDALDQARSSQRLRTALSIEGEWLPTVLREAVERLELIRASHPEAGGLVIAIDQDHARSIAALLRDRFNQAATVVLSDDPDSSARIAQFAKATTPWLVAVRMVSEGVDIPRLRVGVYATTTTTELFFRQAVGRFVRWTPGVKDQKAFLFIPDDPRLRSRAFQIADQRRHSLRKREQERFERDPAALDSGSDEQLSLFAALSAVATEHQIHDAFAVDHIDDDFDPALHEDDPSLVLTLAPPPPLAGERRSFGDDGVTDIGIGGDVGRTRREEKRRLREQNAELVAALVRTTGQTHAQVNAELNRLSGVGRITEATVAQLRTRLDVAHRLARAST
jgi:superfamily II DNA or RNA helicase